MGEVRRGKIGRVDFLRARIAEDEDWARAASEGQGYARWSNPSTGVVEVAGGDFDGLITTSREAGVHIARWDPAHVLAECEAKRCRLDVLGRLSQIDPSMAADLLMTDLLPYADHPDYPVPL